MHPTHEVCVACLQRVCVLQQRQGLSTGMASSVSSSKTATLTRRVQRVRVLCVATKTRHLSRQRVCVAFLLTLTDQDARACSYNRCAASQPAQAVDTQPKLTKSTRSTKHSSHHRLRQGHQDRQRHCASALLDVTQLPASPQPPRLCHVPSHSYGRNSRHLRQATAASLRFFKLVFVGARRLAPGAATRLRR